jgi:hypothetical protein
MIPTLKVLKEEKVRSYAVTIPLFQGLYAAYVKLVDYKIDCYASTHEDWFHLYLHNWQSDPIVSAREGQSLYSGLVIKSWNHHWQSTRENQFCEFRRQTINDIMGITATQEKLSDGKVIRECFALASTHDDVLKSDLLTKPEFLKTAFRLGFNFMDDILH